MTMKERGLIPANDNRKSREILVMNFAEPEVVLDKKMNSVEKPENNVRLKLDSESVANDCEAADSKRFELSDISPVMTHKSKFLCYGTHEWNPDDYIDKKCLMEADNVIVEEEECSLETVCVDECNELDLEALEKLNEVNIDVSHNAILESHGESCDQNRSNLNETDIDSLNGNVDKDLQNYELNDNGDDANVRIGGNEMSFTCKDQIYIYNDDREERTESEKEAEQSQQTCVMKSTVDQIQFCDEKTKDDSSEKDKENGSYSEEIINEVKSYLTANDNEAEKCNLSRGSDEDKNVLNEDKDGKRITEENAMAYRYVSGASFTGAEMETQHENEDGNPKSSITSESTEGEQETVEELSDLMTNEWTKRKRFDSCPNLGMCVATSSSKDDVFSSETNERKESITKERKQKSSLTKLKKQSQRKKLSSEGNQLENSRRLSFSVNSRLGRLKQEYDATMAAFLKQRSKSLGLYCVCVNRQYH